MQPIDKNKSNKIKRYYCSNPNCNRVFSKPKIIKYYVCPNCQTLINLKSESLDPLTREKPVLEKKQVTKQEKVKPDKNQEPQTIDLTPSQQATTSIESTSLKKPEEKEEFKTIKPAQMEEVNTIDYIFNTKSQNTVKEQTQSSDPQCQHFFGYLSEKNHGEEVPETCFACPKSVECMLNEYNKSKESVEEIKKWYSLKF